MLKHGLPLDSGEFIPAEELTQERPVMTTSPHGQVPEALRLAEYIDDLMDGSMVNYVIDDLEKAAAELRRLHTENEALRTQQPAPATQQAVGNSGFDHKTAADFLSGKTVSDEALRKFVAASRGAHDDRAALRAQMLSLRGELASREAEIALLKRSLLDAEAAAPQPSPTAQAAPAGANVRRSDLVPGVMHCAKCKFQLNRVTLCVSDGNAYAGDNKTEPCPNGCGPLWPVTWEQEARNCWKTLEEMHERLQAAPAAGAVAGPDGIDAIALTRYKVVPSHDSMFHRFAVVAGDGKQQLYLGRETECQNMAHKFAGAFLDGAFYQYKIDAAPTPAAQADSVLEDAARLLRQILAASQDGDSDTHLSAHFVSRIETITKPGGAA